MNDSLPPSSTSVKPHFALIAVQLIFGTWPIVGKIALRALPSTGLVAFRIGGAALALLLLRSVMGHVPITRRSDFLRLALYSLLGVVLNQFLFVKGLELSTAINAALLSTTIPIFTLLVAVLLGYERISSRMIIGMALAACGVVYLINPAQANFSHQTNLGNLILIVNSIAYGAYIAITQDMIKRYGALTVITWIFLFGSIITVPVGGYQLAKISLFDVPSSVWFAVLYIIIMPTVVAYYLNAWALGRVPPSIVAIYIYLQPLFAFAVAPYILGEQLNSRTWIAAGLIFAGVAIVTIRARNHIIEEISERPEAMGH